MNYNILSSNNFYLKFANLIIITNINSKRYIKFYLE